MDAQWNRIHSPLMSGKFNGAIYRSKNQKENQDVRCVHGCLMCICASVKKHVEFMSRKHNDSGIRIGVRDSCSEEDSGGKKYAALRNISHKSFVSENGYCSKKIRGVVARVNQEIWFSERKLRPMHFSTLAANKHDWQSGSTLATFLFLFLQYHCRSC
jgi:hypothetical protein